jgi:hypothetical protein
VSKAFTKVLAYAMARINIRYKTLSKMLPRKWGDEGPVQVHALAGPDPMLEIAVPVAPGPARASCPTMHSAPCSTPYRGLLASVTGSRSRPTAPSFGQIREPSFNVGLTHGVVCHS